MHNYILHPSNMRNRDSEINLRIEEGAKGYGIYMMILELLRDASGYRIANNPKMIAFALNHMCIEDIERVILNYNLFEITEDNFIKSPWLCESLAEMEAKKEKLSEAGRRGARAKLNRAKNSSAEETEKAEQSMTITAPPTREVEATLKPGLSISTNNINKSINKSTNQDKLECDNGEWMSVEVLDAICRGRDANRAKFYSMRPKEDDSIERNSSIIPRLADYYELNYYETAFLNAVTDFGHVSGKNLMKILKIEQKMRQDNFKPKFFGNYILKKLLEQ